MKTMSLELTGWKLCDVHVLTHITYIYMHSNYAVSDMLMLNDGGYNLWMKNQCFRLKWHIGIVNNHITHSAASFTVACSFDPINEENITGLIGPVPKNSKYMIT